MPDILANTPAPAGVVVALAGVGLGKIFQPASAALTSFNPFALSGEQYTRLSPLYYATAEAAQAVAEVVEALVFAPAQAAAPIYFPVQLWLRFADGSTAIAGSYIANALRAAGYSTVPDTAGWNVIVTPPPVATPIVIGTGVGVADATNTNALGPFGG